MLQSSKSKPVPIEHGTFTGAQTHTRRGEIACFDCLDAKASYQRRIRRSAPFHHIEELLHDRPEFLGEAWLGPTIFQLFKETA